MKFYLNQVCTNEWTDWKWQIRNRLTNKSDICSFFPNISKESQITFKKYIERFKFGITPYTLSLIELDENGNPKATDPIWNQMCYFNYDKDNNNSDYNGSNENWEIKSEMPTKILQHKYSDRAIIRVVNECFGHCNYCYMALRVLDKDKQNGFDKNIEWKKTVNYLNNTPKIRDVLISGGDPLILPDEKIEKLLHDLSSISSIKTIRLNTRFITFNPYRLTEDLVRLFKKYKLTVLEIHAVHPKEINDIVDEKLNLFDKVGYRPTILWRSPLIKGVNNKYEVLEEMFLKLYERRIFPYYLFHFAPFSLGRSRYGLSVNTGRELMKKLRRNIPGPAFPRYTLFHIEGKHDIPVDDIETPSFKYSRNENNAKIIRFKNWKGNWVEYPDVEE